MPPSPEDRPSLLAHTPSSELWRIGFRLAGALLLALALAAWVHRLLERI